MFKKLSILGLILLVTFAAAVAIAGDTEDAAKAQAEALKALGMAGMMGQQADVELIGWRDLAKLLPKEIPGMETGKIEGGTFTMDGSSMSGYGGDTSVAKAMAGLMSGYSSAERTYTKELDNGKRKKLTMRVMDSGAMRAMLAGFLVAVEYDTPDGMMKSTEIAGHPAKFVQEFNDDLEVTQTQYMVLVGDRVLAYFEGNQFVEPEEVEKYAKNFPYAKLEALAGSSIKDAIEGK